MEGEGRRRGVHPRREKPLFLPEQLAGQLQTGGQEIGWGTREGWRLKIPQCKTSCETHAQNEPHPHPIIPQRDYSPSGVVPPGQNGVWVGNSSQLRMEGYRCNCSDRVHLHATIWLPGWLAKKGLIMGLVACCDVPSAATGPDLLQRVLLGGGISATDGASPRRQILEEHRKNCERQGKYVEAEIAKNRCPP